MEQMLVALLDRDSINWMPLMWLAPDIFENSCLTHDWHISMFKHCLTGTISYVRTVSLAPFFNSTLSQGHLPLCDIHTYTQPHHFQSLFLNKIWIDPT